MSLSILTTVVAAAFLTMANRATAAEQPTRLTSGMLDSLVATNTKSPGDAALASDEVFLRRATFDLAGRPPSRDERITYLNDATHDRRSRVIDRLLCDPSFGRNWGNYWADVVSYHVPPPELTFLSYTPLKAWFAVRMNRNDSWDAIVGDILTASGKVADNPAATFVGYHQGNAIKLASETARIFLAARIECAQCHDHPFDDWKREQFHHMAAFFARTKGDLGKVQDGTGTVVADKGKGEHHMPDAKDPRKNGPLMLPVFFNGAALESAASDAQRRAALARFVTDRNNDRFAGAFVNRVWARLMGRGFYEPIDQISDSNEAVLAAVHARLSEHFIATGYDVKDLFRLVMHTQAYAHATASLMQGESIGPSQRLRADEMFDSLQHATGLADHRPPPAKPTGAVRFPPPPKSTRDLVNDAFGFDPSLESTAVPRTIRQAMLLMNNDQVLARINADPASGSMLAKLLANEPDDARAIERLYDQVLARRPTESELRIANDHVQSAGSRGAGFEDLLWSLVNSVEFSTRQ